VSSRLAPIVRRFGVGAAATLLLGSSLLVTAAASGPVLAARPGTGSVEVTGALHHDVSAPLGVMAAAAIRSTNVHGPQPRTDRPLRSIPHGNPNRPDGALQGTAGPAGATTPGLGFAGVGNGDYGFAPNAAPPDTNGAVGTTQYVQWVNESFAVFNKATGAKILGPLAGNTLWSGFGDRCATSNDGDPIAQFDKMAQRWVMTQFVVGSTPYLQCVAVSTTSDATGSWNRYSFSYSTQFNDYPKLGVWPDPANNAYFISYNIFNNGTSFAGAKVCAFDRAAMIAGAAATQECFQLSSLFGGLLPADLDGQSLPPAGSPGMFLNFTGNSLYLWRFHPDWTTSANATLTGPFAIPGVASFSAACGGGTCIPQAGVSQKLDSLADRLMYRLAYRNLGDHEALVVNHSVTAGSSVGVRWYELRNAANTTMAAATPTIYQQGTYAPDATFRWMGSVAMDHAGDIAVGYSGSSSSVYPYVAYASRASGDALGTLSAETIVKAGGGSQSSNLSRWGDYSAMTVDPVDDCTFWYTNEYEKSSGAFNWSTWITSFKFPNCSVTQAAPTITSATGTTFTIGSAGSFTVTTTGSPTPAISETGALPGGVTFVDNHNGRATLSGTPAAGSATSYPITITAANGVTPDATQSFTLTVNPAPTQAPAITSSTGTTFTIGTSGSFTVTTTGSPTPVILETGSLPVGVTFVDNHNGTATLSGTPATGSATSYPITITAANGVTPDATQSFTLTVSAVSPLVVTTTSLPNDRKGVPYPPTQLQATGGTTGYTWSIVAGSGALPPGLGLSPGGLISGTPTKVGTFTFTVQVTDSSSQTATATLAIKITQH